MIPAFRLIAATLHAYNRGELTAQEMCEQVGWGCDMLRVARAPL